VVAKRIGSSEYTVKQVHSLQWIFDSFERRPDFIQKKMFGCQAAYLEDRLVLVIAEGQEPWNGLMIPTEREFHHSLIKSFSSLLSHAVLGKWLYISQNHLDFEKVANEIVKLILSGDPRFGVEPKPKKNRISKNKKNRSRNPVRRSQRA
jgi:hypothetical protein